MPLAEHDDDLDSTAEVDRGRAAAGAGIPFAPASPPLGAEARRLTLEQYASLTAELAHARAPQAQILGRVRRPAGFVARRRGELARRSRRRPRRARALRRAVAPIPRSPEDALIDGAKPGRFGAARRPVEIGNHGPTITVVAVPMTEPMGASAGSLQVIATLPSIATGFSLANTLPLPVCTVARFDGGDWNVPPTGTCGGRFVATLPCTATGCPSTKTSLLRASVRTPENGSGIGVGTGPPGDGTRTTCVSMPTTLSPSLAAGTPTGGGGAVAMCERYASLAPKSPHGLDATTLSGSSQRLGAHAVVRRTLRGRASSPKLLRVCTETKNVAGALATPLTMNQPAPILTVNDPKIDLPENANRRKVLAALGKLMPASARAGECQNVHMPPYAQGDLRA